MEDFETKNFKNQNTDTRKKESNDKILLRFSVLGLVVLVAIGLVISALSVAGKNGTLAGFFDFLPRYREPTSLSGGSLSLPYQSALSIEQALIEVVKVNADAVVSVIQTKDVPVLERCVRQEPFFSDPYLKQFFGELKIEIPDVCEKGTQQQEVGGGTGFIIASDGLIVTNKHVVADTQSSYTVLTNDGRKLQAQVLARDPFQDFAILKVDASLLPTVKLGNSDTIEVGQLVVAIGNALGEFRNTVSFGVISGIRRNIAASGAGGFQEVLDEVIQTDAAINPGNSGGPLLNLKGEVIGINTALAQGAQNIGFTIPINRMKRSIESFQATGRIVYPFLGVRYITVTPQVQKERNLSVDYGALLMSEGSEPAVVQSSAAYKAGLKANDIILEINSQQITEQDTLAKLLQRYNPGQKVSLKILRQSKELIVEVELGEYKG